MSQRTESTVTPDSGFSYRAMRSDGCELRGEVAAPNRESAREKIVLLGLLPIELHATADGRRGGGDVPAGDLALGLRLLSTLVNAGLPLDRSLGAFVDVAPSSWTKHRLEAMRAAAREGVPLAQAIEAAGIVLPSHVRGMLVAAEVAGTLPAALRDAAALLEERSLQRAAIRAALAYPVLLSLVGVGAIALLLGVVLPRFANLLAEVGQQLPPLVRALLSLSMIDSRIWLALGGLVLLCAVGIQRVFESNSGFRYRVHQTLLGLPILGPLRHAVAGSRLAGCLSAMLASGVPIPSALMHSAHAAGDDAVAQRALVARDAVIRGERLSQAFASALVVRTTVLQLIRAGEATGEMGQMLRTAATLESEWSTARIRWITGMIEPSLILFFGALIALVASALLQAVYSIRPA